MPETADRGKVKQFADRLLDITLDGVRCAVTLVHPSRADLLSPREREIARMVAVEFEAIYAVSHPGRARLHNFGIFGGSNGFWRTDALRRTRMRPDAHPVEGVGNYDRTGRRCARPGSSGSRRRRGHGRRTAWDRSHRGIRAHPAGTVPHTCPAPRQAHPRSDSAPARAHRVAESDARGAQPAMRRGTVYQRHLISCPRAPDGAYAPHKCRGLWSYVVDLGRNESGRRIQRTQGGFPTKRDAHAALAAVLQETRAGVDVASTITVRQYLPQWLDGKRSLRPSTQKAYREHLHLYLIPMLGDHKLRDLRAEHEGRADDTPEAIEKRLELYHRETKPLVAHYRMLGNLVGIHGDRPEDEVFSELQEALDQVRVAS